MNELIERIVRHAEAMRIDLARPTPSVDRLAREADRLLVLALHLQTAVNRVS